MQDRQEPRPRARSAFTAAFLSLIFPGLGHAYARAWYRAVGFAAAPLLLIALLAGTYLSTDKAELVGVALQPPVLIGIMVGNVVAYLYRIVAAVDAYRVVAYLNRVAEGSRRSGPSRPRLTPISLTGLLVTVLAMGLAHVYVAQWDLVGLSVADLFSGGDNGGSPSSPFPSASATAPDSAAPSASQDASQPGSTSPDASAAATLPPWDGKSPLNILLIGSDQRPAQGTWNTDTLIVVSINPSTNQVAMFTLPRDTTGVPLPNIPARSVYGSTWGSKINALFIQARARPDLFPGGEGGYGALKMVLGNLYGIPIQYYVELNFDGFKSVIDALGGVTINVQSPVVDDDYPGDNGPTRVYIPTGVQHMTGAQALVYARSRHGSTDFDRGARQQRVILSVREQTDIAALAQPGVLAGLIGQVKSAVHTDFPVSLVPQLLELASRIDISNVRSMVFAPPYYSTNLWPASSNLQLSATNVARIRSTVRSIFKFDPSIEKQRQDLAQEGAQVWVVAGRLADRGTASDLAGYLDYRGLSISAPLIKPPASYPAATQIKVYNGAETRLVDTLKMLSTVFGVQPVLVTDATVKVDIIITTGGSTPDKTAPPLP